MANKKISVLNDAVLLTGTELVPIVQPAGDPKDNKKITILQLMELAPVQPGDAISIFTNDANYTPSGANISVFTNDLGYIKGVGVATMTVGNTAPAAPLFGDVWVDTIAPLTLAEYGITDAWATSGTTVITTPNIAGNPTFTGAITSTGVLTLGALGSAAQISLRRPVDASVVGTITQSDTSTNYNNGQGTGHVFQVAGTTRLTIAPSTLTFTASAAGTGLAVGATGVTGTGRLYMSANSTLVLTGGPGAGAENITFGPSNRIFLNAAQVVTPNAFGAGVTATAANSWITVAATHTQSAGTTPVTYVNVNPNLNTTGTYVGTAIAYEFNPNITQVVGLTTYAFKSTYGQVLFGGASGDLVTANTRLDVRGFTVGDAVRFSTSAGSALLRVEVTGETRFGSTSFAYIAPASTGGSKNIGGNGLLAFTGTSGYWVNTDGGVASANPKVDFSTSGQTDIIGSGAVTSRYMRIRPTISNTDAAFIYSVLDLTPSYNFSAGTATIRGIYYNSVNTNLTGATHIAFENTSGQLRFGGITQDDTKTQILTKDGTSNQVFWRDASTFAPATGSANYWKTSGTSILTSDVWIDSGATPRQIKLGDWDAALSQFQVIGNSVQLHDLTGGGILLSSTGGTIDLQNNNNDIALSSSNDVNSFLASIRVGTTIHHGVAISASTFTSATNTVLNVLKLTREIANTATPVAGLGAGIEFAVENTTHGYASGSISYSLTDVTAGSEDGKFVFSVNSAGGAAAEMVMIDGTGLGVNKAGSTSSFKMMGTSSYDTVLSYNNSNLTVSGPALFLASTVTGSYMNISTVGGGVGFNVGSVGTGVVSSYAFNSSFTRSSGTQTHNIIGMFPGINTSLTFVGTLRGVYYNPTVTEATGLTHIAWENTSGQIRLGGVTQNDTKTQVLVKDATTNQVFYRDVATIGSGSYSFSNGLTDDGFGNVTFGGTLSANAEITILNNTLNFNATSSAGVLIKATSIPEKGMVQITGGGGILRFDRDNGFGEGTGFYWKDTRLAGSQLGMQYFADYSASFTERSVVDKGYVDIAVKPYAVFEDVSTTTYTMTAADHFKIKRFTNAAGCTVTVPLSLTNGWQATVYRGAGAGVVTIASAGTLESAAATIDVEKTAATIIHRGSNIHVAVGALGAGGADGGVIAVGTIDSQIKSVNGAVISGTTIVMQTADATNPGLVSTGAQTFAGVKTFNNEIFINHANANITFGESTTFVARASTAGFHFSDSNAGDFAIRSTTGKQVLIGPSGSSMLRVNSTGVGVGGSPSSKFHVTGIDADVSIKVENTSTGLAALRIARTAGTLSDWAIYSPSGSTDLRINAGGDKVTFTSAGILQTSGGGHFKGWVDGTVSGLGVDVGISGGEGYVIAYDRTAATYSAINLQGHITNKLRISSSGNIFTGNVGLGGLTPTASLHLPAGTTAPSTAPLKLTSGTAMSTAENGALEYHSSHLWFTIGTTRYQLDQQGGGGITNTAAANEMMKSDATNAVPSGLFSLTTANLQMGLSTTPGATRMVVAEGSDASVNLALYSKAFGDVLVFTHEFDVLINQNGSGSGMAKVTVDSTVTNTVYDAFKITARTTGAAAPGIGVGMQFEVDTSPSGTNVEVGAVIQAIATSTTGGSEAFDLAFRLMTGGAQAVEKFRFASTGIATAVDWLATSDRRLKKNISLVKEEDVIDKIQRIGAIVSEYDRTDTGKHEVGFIAQELLKVAPEYVVVPQDPEAMMSVNYAKMSALLFKGIQQLLDKR